MTVAQAHENETQGWRSYSSAPPVGTVLCSLDAVAEKGVLSLGVSSERGTFPVIVVMRNGFPRAFVNACPHQYLPLDYQGKNLLSADGARLMCTSHGAAFSIDTGTCVEGPAMGCALDAIPIHIDAEGVIRIG